MSERIVERLSARIKVRSKRSLNHNAVAFAALHDEIVEALSEGYSLKAIWEMLHEEGKIPFKFDAFLRHARQSDEIVKVVNSIKRKKVKSRKATRPIDDGAFNRGDRMVAKEVKKEALPRSSEIPAFRHNPNRTLEDFK